MPFETSTIPIPIILLISCIILLITLCNSLLVSVRKADYKQYKQISNTDILGLLGCHYKSEIGKKNQQICCSLEIKCSWNFIEAIEFAIYKFSLETDVGKGMFVYSFFRRIVP